MTTFNDSQVLAMERMLSRMNHPGWKVRECDIRLACGFIDILSEAYPDFDVVKDNKELQALPFNIGQQHYNSADEMLDVAAAGIIGWLFETTDSDVLLTTDPVDGSPFDISVLSANTFDRDQLFKAAFMQTVIIQLRHGLQWLYAAQQKSARMHGEDLKEMADNPPKLDDTLMQGMFRFVP